MIVMVLAIWACRPSHRDALFIESGKPHAKYVALVENTFELTMTNETGFEYYQSPYIMLLFLEFRPLEPNLMPTINSHNIRVLFNDRWMEARMIEPFDTGWSDGKFFANLAFKVQTTQVDFYQPAELEIRFDSVIWNHGRFLQFGPVRAVDKLEMRESP